MVEGYEDYDDGPGVEVDNNWEGYEPDVIDGGNMDEGADHPDTELDADALMYRQVSSSAHCDADMCT